MPNEKELKEKIKNLYWNCSYKKQQIAEELDISVSQVEEYIMKFKLEIWRMIPWKSEKLKNLSNSAQRLLRAMINIAKSADPFSPMASKRDEANVMTLSAFRNGYLEEIHAGPNSRISDEEMKKLMIESSARLKLWLEIRDAFLPEKPEIYFALVQAYRDAWTKNWEQEKEEYEIERD